MCTCSVDKPTLTSVHRYRTHLCYSPPPLQPPFVAAAGPTLQRYLRYEFGQTLSILPPMYTTKRTTVNENCRGSVGSGCGCNNMLSPATPRDKTYSIVHLTARGVDTILQRDPSRGGYHETVRGQVVHLNDIACCVVRIVRCVLVTYTYSPKMQQRHTTSWVQTCENACRRNFVVRHDRDVGARSGNQNKGNCTLRTISSKVDLSLRG